MATILVVDDQPINRELLVTLLGYGGHRLLEASDGAEALIRVRTDRPDLVITDILMPTMDGYEFVRQLRADSAIARTPVIFFTAHYLEQDARVLAEKAGVAFVMTKPSEPGDILHTVDAALGLAPRPIPPAPADEFEHEHLQLVTDKLSQKITELQLVNQRLGALVEVSEQLASERDPQRLLESVCRAARGIVGAKHALVAVLDNDRETWRHLVASGIASEIARDLVRPPPREGALSALLDEQTCLRLANLHVAPQHTGLPSQYPSIVSMLGVRIASPSRTYGWLCLTDKLSGAEFSEEDERLALTIGSLAGRIYENGSLYTEIQRRAAALEREVEERKQAEAALRDRTRLATLGADIGAVLTHGARLPIMLQRCAEALVQHLDAALARIWTLGRDEKVLELQGSAGMYTHLDGVHSRVPIGEKKIGMIVSERKPHLTNAVIGDPRVTEQDWAKREGMVAFAGYPLIVADEVVGVMAMFARRPLTQFTLDALGSVADEIALGIHRTQTVEEMRALNADLERRVTQRTAQLDAANGELEAFSYSVSHDLRAPLRTIDGFSAAILEDHAEQLDAQGKQHLERVRTAAANMRQLIDDLLSLARVSRGALQRQRVDLSALAAAVGAELQRADAQRLVTLIVAPGVVVDADARLLRTALDNLLGNAWKYTRRQPQPVIELGVHQQPTETVYFVRDNGAGFDMRFAGKLFGAFQRLHGTQEFEGTGIGLATVQRVIHRHGGRIWADAAVGHGATFFFTLAPPESAP